MDRNIREYRKYGGSYATIARCWGVSRQYIKELVDKHGDAMRVEFQPNDVTRVRRFYKEAAEERVFFEREYHEDLK